MNRSLVALATLTMGMVSSAALAEPRATYKWTDEALIGREPLFLTKTRTRSAFAVSVPATIGIGVELVEYVAPVTQAVGASELP